jgi:protein-disulfide isomerase
MAQKKELLEIISPKDIWVGSPNALVELVEYGDYESEACAKVHEVVKRLMGDYEGKLRFNFRHFPLTRIHQHAHKAAEASVAAAQEGKFWEMHDMLFRHRRNLGSISLKSYALEIGIKDRNFLPKLSDSVFGWTVRADLLEGLAKGVRDVPVFFINGELYEGKADYAGMSKAIDSQIRKKKRKSTKTTGRQRA